MKNILQLLNLDFKNKLNSMEKHLFCFIRNHKITKSQKSQNSQKSHKSGHSQSPTIESDCRSIDGKLKIRQDDEGFHSNLQPMLPIQSTATVTEVSVVLQAGSKDELCWIGRAICSDRRAELGREARLHRAKIAAAATLAHTCTPWMTKDQQGLRRIKTRLKSDWMRK